METKLMNSKGTDDSKIEDLSIIGGRSEVTAQLESNKAKFSDLEDANDDEKPRSDQPGRQLARLAAKDSDEHRDDSNSTRTLSISPIAAKLLGLRLGRAVQPTHADPRKGSSRAILSPADSRALSGLNLPLRAPDELIGYRSSRASGKKDIEATDRTSPVSASSSSVQENSSRGGPTTIASPIGGQFQYSLEACVSPKVTTSPFISERNAGTPKAGTKDESQFKCRKRAVLIGISYRLNKKQRTYTRHPESVQKWYDVLVRWFGFLSNEIWILTDSPKSARNGNAFQSHATPEYIRNALHWLIEDAVEGDQLILTYSGDTGMQRNSTNQFNPGHHGFVPSNYPEGDIIWDNEIYRMIKALNPSAKLTIFLDCKLSWNVIRLPFIYSAISPGGYHSTELHQGYLPGSMQVLGLTEQATLALKNLSKREREKMEQSLLREQQYFQQRAEQFKNCATVVCFAATPTRYTLRHKMKMMAARKLEHGDYVSAAVDVIENMMRWGRQLTYRHLIMDMADILSPPGTLQRQIPQVSATRGIDLDEVLPVFF